MSKKTDIIIFSGQSNMQGQSERLAGTKTIDNAYEYKYLDDSLVPLRDPAGENIRYDESKGNQITLTCNLGEWLKGHVAGSACYGNTNLVARFCQSYLEKTNGSVIAVHVAKGSTEIANWLPGTPGYDIIIKKASAAIKKAEADHTVENIFFVWLQGESDAILGRSKEYYKKNLTALCSSLKDSLSIDKFGIIRVGRFTGDERDDAIISAQDEVCQEDDGFIMLTDIAASIDNDSEYIHPYIAGHFSAKGLEMLGRLAGEKLGEYARDL